MFTINQLIEIYSVVPAFYSSSMQELLMQSQENDKMFILLNNANILFMQKTKVLIFFFFIAFVHYSIAQSNNSEELFSKANALVEAGKYYEAAVCFEKCYEIDKSDPNTPEENLGYDSYNAAICYSACNGVDKSAFFYKKAIAHFSVIQNDSIVFQSYFELLNLLINNENIDDAKAVNYKYERLAKEKNNYPQIVNSLKFSLTILFSEGNNNDIIPVLDQIHQIHKSKKALFVTSDVLFFFHKTLANTDSAHYYLKIKNEHVPESQPDIKAELLLELCSYAPSDSLYEKAIAMFGQAGDTLGKAVAANEYGVFLLGKNDWLLSQQKLTYAFKIFKIIDYTNGIATAASNLGYLYKAKNELDSALYYYEMSENLIGADKKQKVLMLNNYAMTLLQKNVFYKAIEKLQEACVLAEDISNEGLMSYSLNNLGGAYLRVGNDEKSLYYFNEALIAGANEINDSYFATLNNIAEVLKNSGKTTQAIIYFEESLHGLHKEINPSAYAILLNNLGNLYMQIGDIDNAEKRLVEAFEISQKHKFISIYSSSIENLGSLYFYKNDLLQAKYFFKLAIDLKRQTGELLSLSSSLNNLAVVHLELQEEYEAEKLLKESIRIIEKVYNSLPKESKPSFLSNQATAYDNLVLCNIRLKKYSDAFHYFELRKAKQLKEEIGVPVDSSFINISKLKKISEEYNEVFLLLTTFSTQEASYILIDKDSVKHISVPVKVILNKLSDNIDVRSKMISYLSQNYIAKLNNLVHDKNISNADVHYLLTVALNSFNALQEQKNAHELKRINKHVAQSLAVEQILSQSESKNIVIFPDVELAFLPFETLVLENDKYLVEEYNVSYSNSASVYCTMQIHEKNNSDSVLSIGVSNFDFYSVKDDLKPALITPEWKFNAENVAKNNGNVKVFYEDLGYVGFSQLSKVYDEILQLEKAFPKIKKLYDKNATESKLKTLNKYKLLPNYSIIHFSTHGLFTSSVPALSSLLLMPEDGISDGFFLLNEISELHMNANLVNLSACESGLGKAYKGEGVVGLSYAFQKAGARSVSMSLWTVDEESTSVFMGRFYEIISREGRNYREALSEVKREFISGKYGKTWSSPYFWGPFVLIGK